MRKIMAVTAGIVLALGPTGTAFAGETGQGKAWGNCQNSSAGGELDPLLDSAHGKGNGGLHDVAVAGGCRPAPASIDRTLLQFG